MPGARLRAGVVLPAERVAGDLEGGVAVDVVPGVAAGVAGLVEQREQDRPADQRREVDRRADRRHAVTGRGVRALVAGAGRLALVRRSVSR